MKATAAYACGVVFILLSLGAMANEGATPPEKSANPLNANIELAYGHEHYSSPLVRFNDEGPLIEIVGRRHVEGDFQHLSASAMQGFTIAQDVSLQTSAALWNRHFPDAPDLDVGIVSIDGSLRFQLSKASIGVGPSFQKIASGGRPFRDRTSLQLDWTHLNDGKGYTSVVFETGDNRHSELFRDLDSRSSLLLLREQYVAPLSGIQDLSVEVGMVRELNRFGYADLSNRQLYVRLGVGFDALGLSWDLSGSMQKAKFDGALMESLPARHDIFYSGDLSAGYSLRKGVSVRWTISGYRNKANVMLYEGRFRGNSLSLNAAF